MKVNIGPYVYHYSVFDLADILQRVGVSSDNCDRIGNWLVGTFVDKFIHWVQKHRKRKIEVHIDKYDTWGMYNTLAVIVAPMLRQLKETKHGFPVIDNEDVPDTRLHTDGKEYDINSDDDKLSAKWDYVLDEMIFAFETIEKYEKFDEDWEEKYVSGEVDWVSTEEEVNGHTFFSLEKGPNHTYMIDMEGLNKERDRIQNSFRLFGKYFWNLWD